MWTRTLKARTNLHQNLMAKALKNLEQRKLIKQVKSVKVHSLFRMGFCAFFIMLKNAHDLLSMPAFASGH